MRQSEINNNNKLFLKFEVRIISPFSAPSVLPMIMLTSSGSMAPIFDTTTDHRILYPIQLQQAISTDPSNLQQANTRKMLMSPNYSTRALGIARCSTASATTISWFSSSAKCEKQRPIFVAATKQHVGKTSTCLALLSGLQKRFDKVGFIKPVGQQHVPVYSKLLDKEIRV